MFLGADGNADPDLSRWSGLATGVPGTVAGLALALERYGTMSLAEVTAPAIALAENGVEVTPGLAEVARQQPRRPSPNTRRAPPSS